MKAESQLLRVSVISLIICCVSKLLAVTVAHLLEQVIS